MWVLCIPFSFVYVFNQKQNPRRIIRQFQENEELFNLSMQELLNANGNQILFSFELDMIEATMFLQQDSIHIEKVKLEENDIKKYPNTVKLIKKFNIHYVSSNGYDIEYVYNSQIGLSHNIAYLSDKKENIYKELSHKKKLIKNNWYYVEQGKRLNN